MKVAVQGLWHLGCVTAAGCAKAGHAVVGLAESAAEAAVLSKGRAPLHEPGLDELLAQGLAQGNLSFSADKAALAGAEVLWVAYDTPVDEEDRADAAFVLDRVKASLPHLDPGCLILLSSQLPAGSAAALGAAAEAARPGAGIKVACSPENLRLGAALKVFLEPDRVVLGADDDASRAKLKALFQPITGRLEWMSVASAEMCKHALNSFLATSVVFANEIARVCEAVGADAAEVARGLKTDQRIGTKAYVAPGPAFAGGTLARDLVFLEGLSGKGGFFGAAIESNRRHGAWPQQALSRFFKDGLRGKAVALIGLAYKPGTDALRRSPALELATWLQAQGAQVRGWDALVKALPPEAPLTLSSSGEAAVAGANAVVLLHRWDGLAKALFPAGQRAPVLVDPMGLADEASRSLCPRYARVGWLAKASA